MIKAMLGKTDGERPLIILTTDNNDDLAAVKKFVEDCRGEDNITIIYDPATEEKYLENQIQ